MNNWLLLIVAIVAQLCTSAIVNCAPALDAGDNSGNLWKWTFDRIRNNGHSSLIDNIQRFVDYKQSMDKELSNLYIEWSRVSADAEIEGAIYRQDEIADALRVAREYHLSIGSIIHRELTKATITARTIYGQKLIEWFRIQGHLSMGNEAHLLSLAAIHPDASKQTHKLVDKELKQLKKLDPLAPATLTTEQQKWCQLFESILFRDSYRQIIVTASDYTNRLMAIIDSVLTYEPLVTSGKSTRVTRRFFEQFKRILPKLRQYLTWPIRGYISAVERSLKITRDHSKHKQIVDLIWKSELNRQQLLPDERETEYEFLLYFPDRIKHNESTQSADAVDMLDNDIARAELGIEPVTNAIEAQFEFENNQLTSDSSFLASSSWSAVSDSSSIQSLVDPIDEILANSSPDSMSTNPNELYDVPVNH